MFVASSSSQPASYTSCLLYHILSYCLLLAWWLADCFFVLMFRIKKEVQINIANILLSELIWTYDVIIYLFIYLFIWYLISDMRVFRSRGTVPTMSEHTSAARSGPKSIITHELAILGHTTPPLSLSLSSIFWAPNAINHSTCRTPGRPVSGVEE